MELDRYQKPFVRLDFSTERKPLLHVHAQIVQRRNGMKLQNLDASCKNRNQHHVCSPPPVVLL